MEFYRDFRYQTVDIRKQKPVRLFSFANSAVSFGHQIILLLSFVLICITPSFSQGIKFEEGLSWEQIKAKAKKEQKMIFVDCYATWCGPCKMMDKNVYPNDTVGNYMNKYFVSVKLQMDSTKNDNEAIQLLYPTARKFQKEFAINALPTYLFFSLDGNILRQESGARDRDNFLLEAFWAAAVKTKDAEPDWHKLEQDIKVSSNQPAKPYILWTKAKWYKSKRDYPNYTKYLVQAANLRDSALLLKSFKTGFGLLQLNNEAWQIFLYSNKKAELKAALLWIDFSLAAANENKEKSGVMAVFMDTKANILYKMGNKAEALKLEEIAYSFSKDPAHKTVIEKMRGNEITWDVEDLE